MEDWDYVGELTDEPWDEVAGEGVQSLFTVLGKPVTAYAVGLALAVLLGLLLLWWTSRRAKLKDGTASTLGLLAIPLGLIGARLFYVVTQYYFFEEIGFENAWKLWQGGFALWGAVGGVALAALITAKITGQKAAALLDACAAPAALTIAVSRFAEYFSGEGIGLYVEDWVKVFRFFPFAVQNEFGEWYWAVFMLEGLVALAILAAVLRKERPAGDTARLFLILYSAAQVFLESLRRDGCLKWQFVRVSQLTAAIVLGLLIIAAIIRRSRAAQKLPSLEALIALCAGFAVCIGLCIWMEFAIDKFHELPVWGVFLITALSCVGLGVITCRIVFPKKKA